MQGLNATNTPPGSYALRRPEATGGQGRQGCGVALGRVIFDVMRLRGTRSCSRIGLASVMIGGLGLLANACGAEDTGTRPDPEVQCVAVRGSGATEGDRTRLVGTGDFTFDGVTRPAEVGLYLFEIRPGPNDGLLVDTQYQFNWPNGDSFLSSDEIYFERTLEDDNYRFSVAMTVVSGTGMFTGLEGRQPIALIGHLRFGPPRELGDPASAYESFTVQGTVCP